MAHGNAFPPGNEAPAAGERFVRLDEQKEYYWTGAAWEPILIGGDGTSTPNAFYRVLRDQNGHWLSAYGTKFPDDREAPSKGSRFLRLDVAKEFSWDGATWAVPGSGSGPSGKDYRILRDQNGHWLSAYGLSFPNHNEAPAIGTRFLRMDLGTEFFWNGSEWKNGDDPNADLKEMLDVYLKLDEASGQRNDSHTGALHLSDNNSVGSATGHVYPLAANLVSASLQHLSRSPAEAALQAADADFLVECWLYLNSKAASQGFMSNGTTAGNLGYMVFYNSGTDRLGLYVGNALGSNQFLPGSSFGSPPIATWIHFLGWHDNAENKVKLRINNGAVDEAAVSVGAPGGTSDWFAVGRQGGDGSYANARVGPAAKYHFAPATSHQDRLWNGGAGLALY